MPNYPKHRFDAAVETGDIFIRCPTSELPVSTGNRSAEHSWQTSTVVNAPLNCPCCGRVHIWNKRDAWLEIDGRIVPGEYQIPTDPYHRLYSGIGRLIAAWGNADGQVIYAIGRLQPKPIIPNRWDDRLAALATLIASNVDQKAVVRRYDKFRSTTARIKPLRDDVAHGQVWLERKSSGFRAVVTPPRGERYVVSIEKLEKASKDIEQATLELRVIGFHIDYARDLAASSRRRITSA